ncbi:uncharacterized protein LOC135133877 isoform X2 [Zophobas morio]|uniref:uncharacterized protein LOC135133877 isoform X2 n=1 Tax=Zophobas morio TaxID=2755281 RepID=UPI00308341E4
MADYFPYKGLGLFLVVILVFIVMLIIKCCIDGSRTTKVKRRRHRGNSYQDIYRDLHDSFSATTRTTHTATAPPQQTRVTDISSNFEDLGVDDIVVVPDPNEASPVVVPPYPVEPRHPTPHAAPPGPGFSTHHPPYPTQTPHPMPGAAPYPPVVGSSPYPPVSGAAPYPPAGPAMGGSAPYPDFGAQPPSYSEAISQPPVVQPLPPKEGYIKQAPYNPNY